MFDIIKFAWVVILINFYDNNYVDNYYDRKSWLSS